MPSNQNPLFLRFINREVGVKDLLIIFSNASNIKTSNAAKSALLNLPDLEDFRTEITEAVSDMIKEGLGEEFKAFVNHYMEESLEEELDTSETPLGENRSQSAFVKDENSPWVQGLLCYNLCLYIKAFGLDDLKKCRICGKMFANKGKYAVYCSEGCKSQGKKLRIPEKKPDSHQKNN